MLTINSPWIWTDHDPDQMAQLGQFRLKFPRTKSASWTGFADTLYTLFCNGQVIGVGPTFGHPYQPYLSTWDLTPFLREGENVLAVEVWYDGRREDITDARPLQAGLCGLLVADGQEFPTGPEWKAHYASGYQMPSTEAWRPHASRRLIVADLREEPADWAQPEFDDSAWPAARVLPAHPERIRFRPSPILSLSRIERPLRGVVDAGIARGGSEIILAEDVAKQMIAQTHESLIRPAANLAPLCDIPGKTTLHLPDGDALRKLGWKLENGDNGFLSGGHHVAWSIDVPAVEDAFFLTCDFGRQLTGCLVMDLETTESTMIDIGYAEALIKGRVNPRIQEHSLADRVTVGPGRRVVRMLHDRGFRYAQLSIFGACRIHNLHVEHHAYPFDQARRFACSDQALNAVWDGTVETLEQCALSTLTDNSRRERQGWGGLDLVMTNLAYFSVFGDTRLLGKKLVDFCDVFDVVGKIPNWAPGFCGWFGELPSHDLWFATGCWDYVLLSGDRDSAERLLRVSEGVLGQYDLKKNADGLIADTGKWTWSEWAFQSADHVNTWENLLAAQAWGDVAKMRRWLGHDAQAAEARSKELSQAIVEKLWHPFHQALSQGIRSDGKLSDFCGQLDNALALKLDLLPADKHEAAIRFCGGRSGTWPTNRSGWQGGPLGELIRHEPRQPVVVGSPCASDFCAQAIFHIGQRELALNYIRFNFGAMIDEGEGTAWESWGHWASDFAANCQCQSFGAAIATTLVREVLGLSITEPGGSVVVWKPRSVPIEWAEGRVDTAHGPVVVRWDKERLSWNVPSGVTLRIEGTTNQEIIGPAKSD